MPFHGMPHSRNNRRPEQPAAGKEQKTALRRRSKENAEGSPTPSFVGPSFRFLRSAARPPRGFRFFPSGGGKRDICRLPLSIPYTARTDGLCPHPLLFSSSPFVRVGNLFWERFAPLSTSYAAPADLSDPRRTWHSPPKAARPAPAPPFSPLLPAPFGRNRFPLF